MSEKKSVLQAFGGWVGVALMVIGLVAVLGYEWWQRQGSGDAMQAVAAELGLNVTGVGKRFQMRGRIDDIGVAVDTTTELSLGKVNYYTSFTLHASSGPSGRMVGAGLRQQMIDGWTGEQRMVTGDQLFDDEVFVSGDPTEMLAYLDAEARAAILPAAKAGWSFEGATWSALEAGRITDPELIRTLLTLGLAAVRATRLDSDIETALRVVKGDQEAAAKAAIDAIEARLPWKRGRRNYPYQTHNSSVPFLVPFLRVIFRNGGEAVSNSGKC